jgi:hypothetical protein
MIAQTGLVGVVCNVLGSFIRAPSDLAPNPIQQLSARVDHVSDITQQPKKNLHTHMIQWTVFFSGQRETDRESIIMDDLDDSFEILLAGQQPQGHQQTLLRQENRVIRLLTQQLTEDW